MLNEANYRLVLEKIEACPAEWDQRSWHCGTTHCFAGWAQLLSGKKADEETVRRDARLFLRLSIDEANYLFNGTRTLEDFKDFLGTEENGFDRDGFNRAGFDRDGFDRAGFNRAGFDRDGFDRAGFDRDGFDRDGFDRAGFDRDGFDRDGLDVNLNLENE